MFWGLASGKVDPDGFEFEHVLRDIQTLNEWALEGKLEVTAISLALVPVRAGSLRPPAARRGAWAPATGRSSSRREQMTLGRPAPTSRSLVPGEHDDRFPRPAACFFGELLAIVRCRSTRSSTRFVRAGRRGPAHPRGPAHLRGAKGCRRSSIWASGGCSRPGCRFRSARTSRGGISATSALRGLSDVLRRSIEAGLEDREEALERRAPGTGAGSIRRSPTASWGCT